MNNQKVEINNAQLSLLPSDILEQVSSTKTETQLQSGTLQALKLLAAMETNREFLALLLELGEFRADHLRYLMGPLVFHRTPWAETVPDWLKTACIQDRFETIIDEYERFGSGRTGNCNGNLNLYDACDLRRTHTLFVLCCLCLVLRSGRN